MGTGSALKRYGQQLCLTGLVVSLSSPAAWAGPPAPVPGVYCGVMASPLDWRDCLEQARQTLSVADYLPELLAFLHSDPQPTAFDFYRGLYRMAHLPGLLVALDAADPLLQRQLLRLLADAARQGLLSTAQQVALRPVVFARLQASMALSETETSLLALELAARLGGDAQVMLLQDLLAPSEMGVLALYHWQRLGLKPAQPLSEAQLTAWLVAEEMALSTLQRWQLDPLFQQLDSGQAFLAHWLQSYSPVALDLSETQLQALLHHAESQLRIYGAQRLALRGEAADRPVLEALLQDTDAAVRAAALQVRTVLEDMIPVRDLARLKDPADLPPDTAERLQRLGQKPDYQAQLLSPAFAHLRSHPVYQAQLWQVIQHSEQTALRLQALEQLQPGSWALDRLLPVMHPSLSPALRQQGLRTALRQPHSPEQMAWLKRWQADPDVVLPVLLAEAFFARAEQASAREILTQLAARSREVLPLRQGGTERLEQYINRHWKVWLKNTPDAEWIAWLQWSRDRRLPLSWRRSLIRLAADQGPPAAVAAQLRQMAGESLLAQDLDFARERLDARRLHSF